MKRIQQRIHLQLCTSSGGSIIPRFVSTLTGKCNPNGGSPCKGDVSKVYKKPGLYANQSLGSVYDIIGNKTVCPANQPVIMRTMVPAIKISGNIKKWQCGKCKSSCDAWAAKKNGICPDGVKENSC